METNVLSIILGGGQGSRLYPLSHQRAKPAVPIAGKYRLVDIPISNCINSGLNKIYVLTQFNSASLNRHIKNAYSFDLFSKGFVHVLAAEQTPHNSSWNQGTADAVRNGMLHFEKVNFDYMLILSGDQLYHMDFDKILNYHKAQKADISVATIPVTAQEATGFGILKKNENNEISAFIEKPTLESLPDWVSDTGETMHREGRDYLASMGIYIFNRKVITDILASTKATDFGSEVIPNALGTYKVVSYQHNDYWTDIGTIKSFFEANLGLTDNIPLFNLFDNRRVIYTRSRMLPTAKIMGTYLTNSIISDGCIIRARSLTKSILGVRTRIGENSIIEHSYIMGADNYESIKDITESGNIPMGVGNHCFLKNTIIDKNCRIGNYVHIEGGDHLDDTDTDLYTIKDGIIVVKKGAVIPDNTRIGI